MTKDELVQAKKQGKTVRVRNALDWRYGKINGIGGRYSYVQFHAILIEHRNEDIEIAPRLASGATALAQEPTTRYPGHRAAAITEKERAMNEKEAYGEYIVARAKTWAIYDNLFMSGQISNLEDLDANVEYHAATVQETNTWVQFLRIREANASTT